MPPDATQYALEALTHTKEAKEDIVTTGGIGTDLQPSLFAWSDDGHGYAILTTGIADPLQELHRTVAAIATLAAGTRTHTVAVVKEGYAAERGTQDDPRPLVQRFAAGDTTVHECFTVVTVTAHGDAAFAIQPYTVGLGRVVQWHDHDLVPIPVDDLPLAAILHGALDPDRTTTLEQALATLDDLGFAALWSTGPTDTPA